MMCKLAVELAMASTASAIGLEDSTIQTNEMNIEIVLRSLLVPLNLMVFMAVTCLRHSTKPTWKDTNTSNTLRHMYL